ncbi:MAG: hypothetical protein IPP15_15805 [Saprospiraceae bacterium]|uniref:Uncharacterized protein n=1 Tax=Candidatus Opimibacter skivensis TaxID=2982028 RepID=A0A9D7SV62_9BACT|nr:hypothetical protein [Candidatus Opimibacter skivensis]
MTSLNKAYQTGSRENKGSMARKDIESIFLSEKPGYLFRNGEIYWIKGIHTLNQPIISLGSSSSSSTNQKSKIVRVSWSLIDELMPATLESIHNVDGNVTWPSTLPVPFTWSDNEETGYLPLSAEFEKERFHFKALLIFSDPSGQKYEYIMEGYDSNVRLYRKYGD